MSQQTKWSQFGVLMTVFFFWGFVAASNSIFIPFCKEYFKLDQIQSQLIGSAYYGAYFYGSLLLYLASYIGGTDLLNKIGYKKGVIYGLLISVVGAVALAFISGSAGVTFGLVLVSFFIIALGFSLQQTAAQAFALALGPPESGAHRLTMTGSLNSFGTLLGPIVVSVLLFGSVAEGAASGANISSIQTLYFFLAGLFILVSIVFAVSKLPKTTSDEKLEKSPKALIVLTLIGIIFLPVLFSDLIKDEMGIRKGFTIFTCLALILIILFSSMVLSARNKEGWGAMAYPQLVLGMIAIFIYVGVEVTIDNNFGALLKLPEFGGYDEAHISHLISLYWGSLMIGRWTGAMGIFNVSRAVKRLLVIGVPLLAFAIILLVNLLKGNAVVDLLPYILCIVVAIGAFLFANDRPLRQLLTVCVLGVIAVVIGLLTTGMVANFAFVSCGLFASVMWPCIFALALTGLGKYTSQGSAFLIMMILGGAIIPPAQGAIIDIDKMHLEQGIQSTTNFTHLSYIVPLCCFAYLIWHALKTKSVLRSQGLDVDNQVAAAH